MDTSTPLFIIKYRKIPIFIAILLFILILKFTIEPLFNINYSDNIYNIILYYLKFGHGRLQGSLRIFIIILIFIYILNYKKILLMCYFGNIYIYDNKIERQPFLPILIKTSIEYRCANIIVNGIGRYGEVAKNITIVDIKQEQITSATEYASSRIVFLSTYLCKNEKEDLVCAYKFVVNKITNNY